MKKVVCINNKGFEKWLTIGKHYEILEEWEYDYYIINDINWHGWYFKEWFKTLSEIRNEKIDKLLKCYEK
jgi:hypothetical protein